MGHAVHQEHHTNVQRDCHALRLALLRCSAANCVRAVYCMVVTCILVASFKTLPCCGCRRKRYYSVREYQPFVVAQTPASQDTQQRKQAFRTLARYLFGGNPDQRKMAMTTPVITSGSVMQFVLPVQSPDDAPQPHSAENGGASGAVNVRQVCPLGAAIDAVAHLNFMRALRSACW